MTLRNGRRAPKTPLTLTDDERIHLRSPARSRTPHMLWSPAPAVIVVLRGRKQLADRARLHWTKGKVGKWRQRFLQYRLAGLYDELRPGRPRTMGGEQVAALLKRTLSHKP